MKTGIRILFSTLLGAHFLIVAFSLLPDNPIKHQFKREIAEHMFPIFQQNWNLFAPNPVSSNWTVMYQYKVYAQGRVHTTEWQDAVTPLLQEKKTAFWSPVQRVLKHISSGVIDIMEFNRKFKDYVAENDTLKNDSLKAERLYPIAVRECTGHKGLLQYSSYVYSRLGKPAGFGRPDSVRVRYSIQNAHFPRFSKRDLDYFDKKNYTYTHSTSKEYKIL
ncbi:DUF5819 family protein [Hymenobacter metallicola]|uniref:Uncharacterized protein n=1 Tax=Hymenobacter metallicola TaxID=2563114 RepID=A0A4Z0QFD9_9BACT|nr:DUF5819 family protein [Hymenobacter metallicola]TGE27422.1 hypothetical protein E5K02_13665 [Hymenobacter metallicola]